MTYITIYESKNEVTSANARGVGGYLRSLPAQRVPESWHYSVDQDTIVQTIPDNETAYHIAEQGKGKPGVSQSIAITLCVNNGSDFTRTVRLAATLTAKLMHDHNIALDHVVRPTMWVSTAERTPRLDSGVPMSWDMFIGLTKETYEAMTRLLSEPVSETPAEPEYHKPESDIGKACMTRLDIGSRGQEVSELQQALIDAGYELPNTGADGIYGDTTRIAVRRFQRARGLEIDGIADGRTLAALMGIE